MDNASRSHVTITLGRSGQVVKRAAENGGAFGAGSKKSVMDRLGSNFDSAAHFDNKRQRGDGGRMSLGTGSDVHDKFLAKDDLRFKLMRKKRSQSSSQQSNRDLRDILSRPAKSSTVSLGTQQSVARQEDTRQQFLEPRDGRQQMQDRRSSKQLMSEPRSVMQQLSGRGDYRRIPDPRDGRHLMPELKDGRHFRPGSNSSSFPGQMLSSRSSDALPQMESLRSSHTPWTLDSLRQGPSGRFTGTSRAVSPPRRKEEQVQEQRSIARAYDDHRGVSYASRGILEHPRPTASANYLAKSAQTTRPAKLMGPSPVLRSSASLAPKSSYTIDDQPTVDSFLHSLELDKYAILFKAEEVDMHALRQMGDADLKELGVPMGPRKKIIQSLISRAKRQM